MWAFFPEQQFSVSWKSKRSKYREAGEWTDSEKQYTTVLFVLFNDAFSAEFCVYASDIFVCIFWTTSLVTSPLFSLTSCCPNASLCVSAERTAWVDVSSLKWERKKPKPDILCSRQIMTKKNEKKKLTTTKEPPNNVYHGPFPTALSNTMKHLQKAHSVNTFPECGVLETEKTEGALVCCLVGK